jgi:TetR/AcrR family transcriptional repressor of nem operon
MTQAPGPGRPRQFELADAARNAMSVFWDRGYEYASLSDLIEGIGLSQGRLYKAFGDKKGLLLTALDIYTAQALKLTADILSQRSTATQAIHESKLRHARSSSGEEEDEDADWSRWRMNWSRITLRWGQPIDRMLRCTKKLYASAFILEQVAGNSVKAMSRK